MDVSIIIVSWNGKELLRRCLRTLAERTKGVSYEAFVVDNASSDGSAAMVAQEFPGVTLVANSRNTGFAAACNEGIRRASGEFILLLNPDTELRKDAITTLVAAMRARQEVGIAGPKMLNPDGTLQPSVRRFPTLASQIPILLKAHNVPRLRVAPSLAKYFSDDMDYGTAQRVDQVMGAAFLIRGSVIRDLGMLDERYFIWFEEVDYCKRAAEKGIQTWYLPEASVVHHGGASFAKEFGVNKQRYYNRSLMTYMRIHHGLLATAVVALVHPVSMAMAYLVQWFGLRKKRYTV
jgi:GT2 family glycosyltransferase